LATKNKGSGVAPLPFFLFIKPGILADTYMNFPAIYTDLAGVTHDFLCYPVHLLGRFAGTQVCCVTGQMERIGHATDICIMPGTPNTGAACIHDGNRNSQPPADLVHSSDHLFLQFHREAVAVFSPALAAELLPVKEFDLIPERASW